MEKDSTSVVACSVCRFTAWLFLGRKLDTPGKNVSLKVTVTLYSHLPNVISCLLANNLCFVEPIRKFSLLCGQSQMIRKCAEPSTCKMACHSSWTNRRSFKVLVYEFLLHRSSKFCFLLVSQFSLTRQKCNLFTKLARTGLLLFFRSSFPFSLYVDTIRLFFSSFQVHP